MIFSDEDRCLVAEVCDLWQRRGGDAEGFSWSFSDILSELRRREADAQGEEDVENQ